MCRAVYSYELADPDLAWLLSTFQEERPDCICIENGCLPVVLIPQPQACRATEETSDEFLFQDLITPENNDSAPDKPRHRSDF